MGRTAIPKTERKIWTEDEIAQLRRDYATTDTTELARALGRKKHQLQIKANRLGLHRELTGQRRSSGRPAHTRDAMLQVLQAAGPEGIMLASLNAALPPGKRESAACALYAAVATGESAFVLKLGRFCRYYATAAWRDAAAAALRARHPNGRVAKPGTLRASIQDLVFNAGPQGVTIDGLDSTLPGQLRAKINLAATWMANAGLLHCWGTGPGKRYFSNRPWLEAHAQAEHRAGRTAPTHLAPQPREVHPTSAPPARTAQAPTQARAEPPSHSAAKRQRKALAKLAAALPGTRQIELATQRARAQGRLGTDRTWVPPSTSQPIDAVIPPGLQIQRIESKACYRHELAASNDSGAGFSSAGVGRYVEPVSSWVEAVTERRAA